MAELKLNYIGSKRTLLPLFAQVFDRYVTADSVFADYFCGTGVVANFVQARYPGVKIRANDLQTYASTITQAKLATYTAADVATIQSHYVIMNELQADGFFTEHYADKYFSRDNCRRIDGCRRYIQQLDTSELIRTYLLAALLSAADSVANTAAVYGAYLKQIKASARLPLHLSVLPSINAVAGDVIVTTENICTLQCDTELDVLYLDPPYNARQYGSNYHVLETLVKYDQPPLKGVTLLPPYPKSSFCSKAGDKALQSLREVVQRFKWRTLLLSYSSDGIMSLVDIVNLLLDFGRVIVNSVHYKRFQSQVKTGTKVTEYLIICERGEATDQAEYKQL